MKGLQSLKKGFISILFSVVFAGVVPQSSWGVRVCGHEVQEPWPGSARCCQGGVMGGASAGLLSIGVFATQGGGCFCLGVIELVLGSMMGCGSLSLCSEGCAELDAAFGEPQPVAPRVIRRRDFRQRSRRRAFQQLFGLDEVLRRRRMGQDPITRVHPISTMTVQQDLEDMRLRAGREAVLVFSEHSFGSSFENSEQDLGEELGASPLQKQPQRQDRLAIQRLCEEEIFGPAEEIDYELLRQRFLQAPEGSLINLCLRALEDAAFRPYLVKNSSLHPSLQTEVQTEVDSQKASAEFLSESGFQVLPGAVLNEPGEPDETDETGVAPRPFAASGAPGR